MTPMKRTVLVLFALLATAPAFADDSSATAGVSEAQSPSVLDKLSKKAALTYFGVARGAGLNDLGNKYQPAADGTLDTTSTQGLESVVTTGYRLNQDTLVGGNVHFFYSPVGNPTGGDKNFEWMDPSLLVSRANLIKVGGLSVKGILSATLPSSQYDYLKKHVMATALTNTYNLNYDVPDSTWSLGLYGYVTAYVPGATPTATYRDYKVYVAPNANWQFSKKVAATMWVDLIQATRANTVNGSILHGLRNTDMDIEPGISWEFAKGWSVNPMINIYPRSLTMAASSIQAVIAGKAL